MTAGIVGLGLIGGSFAPGEEKKISVVGKAKTIAENTAIKPGEIY